AIKFLKDSGVLVQSLSKDVIRNEDKCTHCGLCIVYCPTGALFEDRASRKVIFEEKKCIGCEICVKICPTRAMEVDF
ncbi:MAG: 4Fe-4S binding protein, partial [Candidatus Omnitrophica bacterium]|nr:4Fe-4S binding protein [Candidatus Omnitrophota bacterium]